MKLKRYNIFILTLIILIHMSCSDTKRRDDEKRKRIENSDSIELSRNNGVFIEISKDPENNLKRLNLIKQTIEKYGFLKLPYKYYYNSDSMGGISTKINSDLFHSVGIGFSKFIGVLPDTTTNYYILTSMALSVPYLYISCINKQGEYLFYKSNSLFECNCLHMVEQDIYCNEYVVIKDGLKLEYYYKTKYVLSISEGQNDTICEFKTGVGFIDINDFGKIIYKKIVKKNCLENE